MIIADTCSLDRVAVAPTPGFNSPRTTLSASLARWIGMGEAKVQGRSGPLWVERPLSFLPLLETTCATCKNTNEGTKGGDGKIKPQWRSNTEWVKGYKDGQGVFLALLPLALILFSPPPISCILNSFGGSHSLWFCSPFPPPSPFTPWCLPCFSSIVALFSFPTDKPPERGPAKSQEHTRSNRNTEHLTQRKVSCYKWGAFRRDCSGLSTEAKWAAKSLNAPLLRHSSADSFRST